MSYFLKILVRSLVKPFYRENAGFFVFIFTVMFFVVGTVDGAGLMAYHYSLATGMLGSYSFLLLVFAGWFLYVQKCAGFVTGSLRKPEYHFLYIYNSLTLFKRLLLFFLITILLLLPVLLYALFVVIIGWQLHLYRSSAWIIFFLSSCAILSTIREVYLLNNTSARIRNPLKFPQSLRLSSSFPFLLLRFISTKQKLIWSGIKFFTCGPLYLIAANNVMSASDTRMVFLFFMGGIMANGTIVYRLRNFEEIYLSFYRGLPVPLLKRLLNYSFVYFILLIPELLTLAALTHIRLSYSNAIGFFGCGYCFLLLMNSVTFVKSFSKKEFLPVLLLIFCVQYICMMTIGFLSLSVMMLFSAILLFFTSYYKGQRNIAD